MVIPSILKGPDMPKHLAVNATRISEWSKKKGKPLDEAASKSVERLNEFIDFQLKKDIPILTLNLSSKTEEEIAALNKFFRDLASDARITSKKVRVYVIGDWYDIDPELTDSIHNLMEKTKDYDAYFLCFCLKYDGQKELLAGVKLLAKKAVLEKISVDDLTLDLLKENLPTSYFIPPEIIIETEKSYSGLLLWDSKGALIYYAEKMWLDFERKDLEKAIDYFNQVKKS